MGETKYWTWHMTAGVVILFLLGLHMCIMHTGAFSASFAPHAGEATSADNSMFRDSHLFFTVTYVILLALGLYHGLYGLRTMLFELTLKPAVEGVVTGVLVVLGFGLFGLGTWAALVSHSLALAGRG